MYAKDREEPDARSVGFVPAAGDERALPVVEDVAGLLRDAQELAVAIAGPAVRAVVARRAADRTVWLCDTGRQRPALMLEAFTTQVTPIGPASEQVLAVAGYRPGDQATVTVILDGDDRIVTGHLRAEVWLTLVSTHDLLSGAWRIRGATPDGATTFDDPFLVGGRRVTA